MFCSLISQPSRANRHTTKDALAGKHGEYDIVLANPPFGKKSSVTIVNEAGEQSKESLIINRDAPLCKGNAVAHPICCFGDLRSACFVTVGLSTSPPVHPPESVYWSLDVITSVATL